jgi:8-oxo-dGTP pyrophosphatase MutT (NUDIX family)
VRELFEETGLKVAPEDLGESIWQTSGRWDWSDGNFHTYTDTFFQLKVEGLNMDASGWTDDERRDVLEFRWWKPQELLHTADLVGPHGLAEFLAGNPF